MADRSPGSNPTASDPEGSRPVSLERGDVPPPRDLRVEPTALPAPRAARWRALAAGAVVVAVIGIGIALASLTPSRLEQADRPSVPGTSERVATVPSAAPDARPSAAPGWPAPADPAPLTPQALNQGVIDGSLDGSLVFLRGRLGPVDQTCDPGRDVRCATETIQGLDVPLMLAPALAYAQAPLPGAVLVTRPDAGRLVYLGALSPDPVTSMTGLLTSRPGRPFLVTLSPVGGWLLTDPHGLCTPAADGGRCPVSPPFLADDRPLRNGTVVSDRGSVVALEAGAVGLGDGTTRLVGTFLVRHAVHQSCEAPAFTGAAAGGDAAAATPSSCPAHVTFTWDVVARLEGVRRFEVTMP